MSKRDYSLIGRDAEAAVAKGLAAAEWYRCDIPRKQMKELMTLEKLDYVYDMKTEICNVANKVFVTMTGTGYSNV